MLPVGAVVVAFDGTACLHDVAEHLLERFADPAWRSFDEAWERGEIGRGRRSSLRVGCSPRTARRCSRSRPSTARSIRPSGRSSSGSPVTAFPVVVASDGFGFYVEPLFTAHGIERVEVVTNEQRWDDHGRPDGMRFVSAHPECIGCGTCKLQAVARARAAHGRVAFVGEGPSDRYGALYADVAFAKDALVEISRADGVPFLPWNDFHDIRCALEELDELPGPVAPLQCPGWTIPGSPTI